MRIDVGWRRCRVLRAGGLPNESQHEGDDQAYDHDRPSSSILSGESSPGHSVSFPFFLSSIGRSNAFVGRGGNFDRGGGKNGLAGGGNFSLRGGIRMEKLLFRPGTLDERVLGYRLRRISDLLSCQVPEYADHLSHFLRRGRCL